MCLVISKLDRLCLEMKLPPSYAYLKIKHTIEEINGILSDESAKLNLDEKIDYLLSPILGNVIFSCSEYGFFFSLKTFAENYTKNMSRLRPEVFQKVLWGNFYFDKDSKKFLRKKKNSGMKRAFVEFILEPLYKIMGHTVSFEKENLEPVLR